VPVFLSGRRLFAEVGQGEQFYAVVGLFMSVNQPLELLHPFLSCLERVFVDDVPVPLSVVLNHLRQRLLAEIHPLKLSPEIGLKL
jgi:hypothetical protein